MAQEQWVSGREGGSECVKVSAVRLCLVQSPGTLLGPGSRGCDCPLRPEHMMKGAGSSVHARACGWVLVLMTCGGATCGQHVRGLMAWAGQPLGEAGWPGLQVPPGRNSQRRKLTNVRWHLKKKKSTCELLMSAHVTGVWSSCDLGKSQRNTLILLLPQADAS